MPLRSDIILEDETLCEQRRRVENNCIAFNHYSGPLHLAMSHICLTEENICWLSPAQTWLTEFSLNNCTFMGDEVVNSLVQFLCNSVRLETFTRVSGSCFMPKNLHRLCYRQASSETLHTLELGSTVLSKECSQLLSRVVESNHVLQKFEITTSATDGANLILLLTSAHNLITLDLLYHDMTVAEYFSLFRFLEKNQRLIDVKIYPYLMFGAVYKYKENFMKWACAAVEKHGVNLEYTLDELCEHPANNLAGLTYFELGAKVPLKKTWSSFVL